MNKQMKAAVYRQFGSADKIEITTIDIPELKEGEVLVRVIAAGVNPVDSAVREGLLKAMLPANFPVIPGWDVAGIVEARGYSARRFEIGDEVYAYARRPLVQWGTFAEYLVIPESYLAHKPRTLSSTEAAGIPLVGLTAYQSLVDEGKLKANESVLILGASGGIGTMGIQIAKNIGATVIGVASKANHPYMKELGADYTLEYQNVDIAAEVMKIFPEGIDLIFDAAAGESMRKSLGALKRGGTLVSILHHQNDLGPDINFKYHFVEPNSSQLDILAKMAESGKLQVPVSQWFPLNETAKAMRQIETHHTRGKVIIVP